MMDGSMTKEEVLEMLDDMERTVIQSSGFIAGFVTEGFVLSMIRRKKAEVEGMAGRDGRREDADAGL